MDNILSWSILRNHDFMGLNCYEKNTLQYMYDAVLLVHALRHQLEMTSPHCFRGLASPDARWVAHDQLYRLWIGSRASTVLPDSIRITRTDPDCTTRHTRFVSFACHASNRSVTGSNTPVVTIRARLVYDWCFLVVIWLTHFGNLDSVSFVRINFADCDTLRGGLRVFRLQILVNHKTRTWTESRTAQTSGKYLHWGDRVPQALFFW